MVWGSNAWSEDSYSGQEHTLMNPILGHLPRVQIPHPTPKDSNYLM